MPIATPRSWRPRPKQQRVRRDGAVQADADQKCDQATAAERKVDLMHDERIAAMRWVSVHDEFQSGPTVRMATCTKPFDQRRCWRRQSRMPSGIWPGMAIDEMKRPCQPSSAVRIVRSRSSVSE